MIKFEHFKDKLFLAKILSNNYIKKFETDYNNNFDFRPIGVKRKEFNRKRNEIYSQLIKKHGEKGMLNLNKNCLKNKELQIDHRIPLSSNILNKKVRKMKAEKGKKVLTQSLGSNHIDNLILACRKCNGFKKNRFIQLDLKNGQKRNKGYWN